MDTGRRTAGSAGAEDHGVGARIGMWLFLLSEILLFGGLFLLYSVYRFRYPAEFHAASLQLNRIAGTANTAVLLTSSLAVALSLFQLRVKADPRRASLLLAAAIGLGAVFLVV
jgi:cytochrome c oxidase subunit 3